MCRALIADQRMAQIVLSTGTASLRAEADIVSALCAEAAGSGNLYPALAIIAAGTDAAPAISVARKMLDAAAAQRIHVPGLTEFTGGWQETASLAAVLEPADRARLGESMTAVATDTDEPRWNRQQALAALAAVGRYLSDADRKRLFPVALQAARGSLDSADDDDTLPSGQLDRSRINLGDPTLGFDGILASAALASTPDQYQSVIDLAYELMPQARPHQANRIAQALALLPVAGRALLDPRALAGRAGVAGADRAKAAIRQAQTRLTRSTPAPGYPASATTRSKLAIRDPAGRTGPGLPRAQPVLRN